MCIRDRSKADRGFRYIEAIMSWWRQNPGRAVRRVLLGLLYTQVATIIGLMTYSGLRKRLRVVTAKGLPISPPANLAVGESTATTYTFGQHLYADMLAEIRGAKHRILFETYIWKADGVGKEFKSALVEAAERGVEVYVIYDGFANLVVSPRFFRFPESIHVLRYPVFATSWRIFDVRRAGRDHR